MVMDWKIKRVSVLLAGLLIMGFSSALNAQDLNEAKRAIKKGDQEKRSENYEEAITAFDKCIQITTQLEGEGPEVAELKGAAEKKVTKSHLDYANDLLKQEKHDLALKHYKKTVELAKKYGQQNYGDKARKNLPKVYYAKGRNHASEDKYEEAIELFNKAIEGDPNYGWAYIRKAQAYQKLGKPDEMEMAVQQAVQIGEKSGQRSVVNTAKKLAYGYFYNNGAKALKAKKYKEAIPHLNKATQYNGSVTLHHYLAISYGQVGDFEKAVEQEKMVIDAMKGESDKDELAKYYYTLGTYYEQLGQKANACDAYKNAVYGDYKANAEYKIKHTLKCQ